MAFEDLIFNITGNSGPYRNICTTSNFVVNVFYFIFFSALLVFTVYNVAIAIYKVTLADGEETMSKFKTAMTNIVLSSIGLVLMGSVLFIPNVIFGLLGMNPDLLNGSGNCIAYEGGGPGGVGGGHIPDAPPAGGGPPGGPLPPPPADGGSPPADGGSPPADGGSPPADGGSPPADPGDGSGVVEPIPGMSVQTARGPVSQFTQFCGGSTTGSPNSPNGPIDHVLVPGASGMVIEDSYVDYSLTGSDHFPVIATIRDLSTSQTMKVMTYNIHNPMHIPGSFGEEYLKKVARYIADNDISVVSLQEVGDTNKRKGSSTPNNQLALRILTDSLKNLGWMTDASGSVNGFGDGNGIGLISKFPFQSINYTPTGALNLSVSAVADTPIGKVTLYGGHSAVGLPNDQKCLTIDGARNLAQGVPDQRAIIMADFNSSVLAWESLKCHGNQYFHRSCFYPEQPHCMARYPSNPEMCI